MQDAQGLAQKLWEILNRKTRNLSPEERTKYGSISEQNKLAVTKTLDYHASQPHLDCREIDYEELISDYADRTFLANLVSNLTESISVANNIRITHDYDAFSAASLDYRHSKYMMETEGGAGWENKYNDQLQFFKTYDGPPAATTTEK